MRAVAGIVGGTGIGDRLGSLGGTAAHVPTEFGIMRARIVSFGNRTVALASRHSRGHRVPPHKVEYRALALGMKALGVRAVFATAATGSLRGDWTVGTMAVCSDFLDLSGRFATLFDREVVHSDFTEPFACSARQALLSGAAAARIPVHPAAVYVCGNGPRYETPGEIEVYRRFGGDVVGMTAASEAIAMREAGVPYACLAVVTNLACGIASAPLRHEDVVEEMRQAGGRTLDVLRHAVEALDFES